MSKYFEIVIFTASIKKYAQAVYRKIDQHKVTSGMLFREHCSIDPKTQYMVKDMSIIGRPIESVIIIDNTPFSYMY